MTSAYLSHSLSHVSAGAYAWNLDLSGRWAQPCQLFVGGWETVCFREIGWLFGAARGLEAPDLGAECDMDFLCSTR